MAYGFTFWTCYVLLREYEKVALMRLQFLASEKRRPDQFSVKYDYSFTLLMRNKSLLLIQSLFMFILDIFKEFMVIDQIAIS